MCRSALAVAQGCELLIQPDLAEKTYRAILKRKPDDPDALPRLAGLLLRYDKNAAAEPILRRMLAAKATIAEDIPGLRRKLALVITAPEATKDRVDEALALLAKNKALDDPSQIRTRSLVQARRAELRADSLREIEAMEAKDMTPQEQLRLAKLYDTPGTAVRSRTLVLDLIQRDPANSGLISAMIEKLLQDK